MIHRTLIYKKECKCTLYTSIEIRIPEAMKPYVAEKNVEEELQRNALLLYPRILSKKISHGKVAEILGISKSDLICMEKWGSAILTKQWMD